MTFLASPGIDPGIRKTVQDALLAIADDDEYFDILAELNSDGFIEVDTADYEGLADILTRLLY